MKEAPRRIIVERDGLRLQQSAGPNAYLEVVKVSDGSDVVSTPCVVTEPKDEIIRLLFAAWLELAEPAAPVSAPAPFALPGESAADTIARNVCRECGRFPCIGHPAPAATPAPTPTGTHCADCTDPHCHGAAEQSHAKLLTDYGAIQILKGIAIWLAKTGNHDQALHVDEAVADIYDELWPAAPVAGTRPEQEE
jgi:hypothetical protein